MSRLYTYLFLLFLGFPFRVASQNSIGIGLLLPDREHPEIIKAAELAIEQANAEGGYKDREFRLFVRTAEGFWGAGSKESVNLVYEDEVRAIIGSLDGRNAHLAEQVAAKSHLAYIETYATEPTLSQAFVPWFKRVVPNDNQQAELIVDQIVKNGGGTIAILSTEGYDSGFAVRSLSQEVSRKTERHPELIMLDSASLNLNSTLNKLLGLRVDHLLIPFYADGLDQLKKTLQEAKAEPYLYGTLHFAMGVEERRSAWSDFEGIYLPVPVFDRSRIPGIEDSRSAYIYDAFMLVIDAIKHAGTLREDISEYLSETMYNKGLTGKIYFDELGNRQDAVGLVRISDGSPQNLK